MWQIEKPLGELAVGTVSLIWVSAGYRSYKIHNKEESAQVELKCSYQKGESS